MSRVVEPSGIALVSARLEAIKGIISETRRTPSAGLRALDRIEQVASANRTRSGLEPGGSASVVRADVPTVLDALDVAAGHLRQRVASCASCDASPSGLCDMCDGRLARVSAFGALAVKLGGDT